jgi:hypothetical protein
MSFEYRIEALTVWPFEAPRSMRNPVFSAGYVNTLELLGRELRELGTKGTVIFQLVTDGQAVRKDGMLRSGAKVGHQGVAVAFACRHGNLIYPCATYGGNYKMPGWQANLRAIALSLEALRAADRHGVAGKGQQYRGWRAIESAPGSKPLPFHDPDSAWRYICAVAQTGDLLGAPASNRAAVVRIARREAHPDKHDGSRDTWDLLAQAIELARSGGLVGQ